MGSVRATGKRLGAAFGLTLAAALSLLALTAATPASAEVCPGFRVLHNDRIGKAIFPAGRYEISTDAGLNCSNASRLFSRFLEDWDGNLPRPWRVNAEGRGRTGFSAGSRAGFTVSRQGGEGGGRTNRLGRLCGGAFTVNAGSQVGPLFFRRGRYLRYIPARSGISCRRASVLFTRFLSQPNGILPYPWRLLGQTATFYKPAHPARSAFRIEPLNGVG